MSEQSFGTSSESFGTLLLKRLERWLNGHPEPLPGSVGPAPVRGQGDPNTPWVFNYNDIGDEKSALSMSSKWFLRFG